jgi:hypothetical protein
VDLTAFAEHAATVAGLAVPVGVILRYGPDAALRLVAGLTAILARDKRSRAKRALDVLRALRGLDPQPIEKEARPLPEIQASD